MTCHCYLPEKKRRTGCKDRGKLNLPARMSPHPPSLPWKSVKIPSRWEDIVTRDEQRATRKSTFPVWEVPLCAPSPCPPPPPPLLSRVRVSRYTRRQASPRVRWVPPLQRRPKLRRGMHAELRYDSPYAALDARAIANRNCYRANYRGEWHGDEIQLLGKFANLLRT